MSTLHDTTERAPADGKPIAAKRVRPSSPDQYCVVNRAAIGSVALCVLGLTSLMFPMLLILPLAGLLLGFSGYRAIRRYPDEFTGLNLARFGMLSCSLLFVGVITSNVVEYVTEVPEGYTRVHFSELQPESKARGNVIPKRAMELRGQKVFIKGYMHPGVAGMGKVKQFVLVPDMGTCCFGGQPAPTDMIFVNTTDASRVSYARRTIKLAGTFEFGDHLQDFGEVRGVLYRLEVDQAK
jgi:hypothetical protein